MKDVTFGQYYPSHSFVHKMDPRVKILAAIAYIVAVFLVQSYHFVGFAACLLFVLITTAAAKVPFFRVLSSIKAILFFVFLFYHIFGELELIYQFPALLRLR